MKFSKIQKTSIFLNEVLYQCSLLSLAKTDCAQQGWGVIVPGASGLEESLTQSSQVCSLNEVPFLATIPCCCFGPFCSQGAGLEIPSQQWHCGLQTDPWRPRHRGVQCHRYGGCDSPPASRRLRLSQPFDKHWCVFPRKIKTKEKTPRLIRRFFFFLLLSFFFSFSFCLWGLNKLYVV